MRYCKHPTIRIAMGKLKRKALNVPVIKAIHKRSYGQAIERHASRLPTVPSRDVELLEILEKELVLMTSTDALSIPSTQIILNSADRLVQQLRAYAQNDGYLLKLPQNLLLDFPEIFLWGLNQRLLDIAENYIGLPIHYHGSTLSINIANSEGDAPSVRQWHLDPEDYRVLKVIIYLNDVDIGKGPFEFISKDLTEIAIDSLNYDSGFISDDLFEKRAVSRTDWQACTGQKGTIVIADTGRLFHRAKPSFTGARYALTYTYTSRRPKGLGRMWNYSPEWIELLETKLDRHQMQYLNL